MSVEFATWKAVLLLLTVGGLGAYYFQKEKERLHKRREMEANKSIGTPLIGGPFTLQDTKGNKFTEQNLVDPNNKRFSILYFGFTHCPDVCPEELDKLGICWTNWPKMVFLYNQYLSHVILLEIP